MQTHFRLWQLLMLPVLCCSLLVGCQESNSSTDSQAQTNAEITSPETPTQGKNTPPTPSATPNAWDPLAQTDAGQEVPLKPEPDLSKESDSFYFSYDDSGSTASRDLTLFALKNQHKPEKAWGRAYEYLTAESIGHFNNKQVGPFSLSIGLYKSAFGELVNELPETKSLYSLGVNISGPTMSHEDRKNVVLTLLVDTSGSMGTSYARETRTDIRSLMDVAKHALTSMLPSLKTGDIINIVEFNSNAQVLLEGWQYDADDSLTLSSAVAALENGGSTNLNAGIILAYQLANRYYDSQKANRIIMLTDAYANSGQVDSTIIAQHTLINGLEGIHFAGIGIGSSFNDAFLNNLTDIGKGVYSAMITPNDAERIFTDGFMRFIDHAVENIRFQLHYPSSWQHVGGAAEQVSEHKDEVQTVNFSYNSEQFFLEQFIADHDRAGQDVEQITLSISYNDEQQNQQQADISLAATELLTIGELEIKTATAVYVLAELVAERISCQQVSDSDLYHQEIDHPVFKEYKLAIAKYCQW